MRHLLATLVFFVLLIASYLVAGAIQVSAFYYLSGGSGVPRMVYERMPYVLLLSVVAPALAVDNLMNGITSRRLQEFLLFLFPFCTLVVASFRFARRTLGAARPGKWGRIQWSTTPC